MEYMPAPQAAEKWGFRDSIMRKGKRMDIRVSSSPADTDTESLQSP